MATGDLDLQTMLLLGMGSQLMTPRSQGGGFAGLGNSALGISQAYGKSQSDKLYRQSQMEDLQARAEARKVQTDSAKQQAEAQQRLMELIGSPSGGQAVEPHQAMVMPESLAAQGVRSRFNPALEQAAKSQGGQPQGAREWTPEMVMLAQRAGIKPEAMALMANPGQIGREKPLTLSQGEKVLDPKTYQELASNPKAPEQSSLAKLLAERSTLPPGSPMAKFYDDMIRKQTTHQPATNVTVNAGNDLAKQVGDIMKGERMGMDGAMRMFNSADQLGAALDSGQVITGPGADVKTKALQIGRVLGVTGKTSEEMLVNTRAAIKSLAEMGVQARKELAGQGQITEKEAEAVQKAYAGDLSSLTEGELRMLVDVTKRAASLRAKGYQSQLQSVPKELQPFYSVPGLDQVSGYKGAARPKAATPAVPNIDDLVKKYGG
jgi:hypothetical protein